MGPSCVFQSVASYDDAEEEEGTRDGGGGGDDGEDTLHRVLVIGLMGVDERVEACVLALVLCHHMLSMNVEGDAHLCTFVYVVHSVGHLQHNFILMFYSFIEAVMKLMIKLLNLYVGKLAI